MNRWTLHHLLFPLWWVEAFEDTRADWAFLILPFPEHACSESAKCRMQTAAWVLGAMQPRKGFLLRRPQQHGWSITMDGSPACGSGAAARGVDIPSLPYPVCRILLPAPERSFAFQCIPRSFSNTTILYFLWGFLKISSNFLSPITQHFPCNHTSVILQCKVPIKHQQANTAETLFSHGCSGNDCTTCRDRLSVYELWEQARLSELPALAWAGLRLRPIYLAFFPNWQWRKQSKRNIAMTGRNLAHFIICAGLSGQVSCRLSHPVSNLVPLGAWGQECVSLSESTIYIHVCLWELRPELFLHEEGTCSSSIAALRHDVYRRQRQAWCFYRGWSSDLYESHQQSIQGPWIHFQLLLNC